MIEVEGLHHDYTGRGEYAVRDVSFTVGAGEIFGLLGPSGAGKTTVQNLMTGLLSLQQGDIRYDGVRVDRLGRKFFNRVGVSFEQPNLYARLTGYENLYYFSRLFDVPTEDPLALLEMVGLRDDAHKMAGQYSRGMRQRLVFVRSLVNNPEILFLDEPTGGLDPNTAAGVKEIINQRKQRGRTILLTTHNMFLADELCDRVAFVDEGEMVALDTPRNLKLQWAKNAVRVEHVADGGEEISEVLRLDDPGERRRLQAVIEGGNVLTLHSQEATLEQVFISMTGKVPK
ncbi:MAG: ABC transporter ATP-binding protein [Bacillota bacterium]